MSVYLIPSTHTYITNYIFIYLSLGEEVENKVTKVAKVEIFFLAPNGWLGFIYEMTTLMYQPIYFFYLSIIPIYHLCINISIYLSIYL